jgi:hypothetical protein
MPLGGRLETARRILGERPGQAVSALTVSSVQVSSPDPGGRPQIW